MGGRVSEFWTSGIVYMLLLTTLKHEKRTHFAHKMD